MSQSISHQTRSRLILPSEDLRWSQADVRLSIQLHRQLLQLLRIVANLDTLRLFYLTFVVWLQIAHLLRLVAIPLRPLSVDHHQPPLLPHPQPQSRLRCYLDFYSTHKISLVFATPLHTRMHYFGTVMAPTFCTRSLQKTLKIWTSPLVTLSDSKKPAYLGLQGPLQNVNVVSADSAAMTTLKPNGHPRRKKG